MISECIGFAPQIFWFGAALLLCKSAAPNVKEYSPQASPTAAKQPIAVPKNGYIYVYCSNESSIDVFFDNLQVVHTRGAILEESHYYPFGLIQAGISGKAAGEVKNKEKTFQGQRFDDDLDLNWVQFKWRNHDVQIGRFIELDPLSEKYVYNSTYAFSENKVTNYIELEGLEAVRPYFLQSAQAQAQAKQQQVKQQTGNSTENKTSYKTNPISIWKADSKPTGITMKQTGDKSGGSEEQGLIGSTSTNKISQETPFWSSPWKDEITTSHYTGTVSGKEGSLVTTDGSTNNGKFEGGSISLLGVINAGYGTDGSVSVGVGAFGYELHGGVGVGNGLGQVSVGASHTSNGNVSGGDVTFKAGGGAAAVVFVLTVLPKVLGVLAL